MITEIIGRARATFRLAIVIGLVVLPISGPCIAQQTIAAEDAGDLVHYSYSALFGTGWYQLEDRSVAIIRIPIGFQLREATPDKFGIRLEVPTTVGLQNFDFDSVPELDLDSLATLTILPGVKFNFKLSDNWELDPSVYLGYGRDLSNDEGAVVYGGGVTSRYALDVLNPRLTLGSNVLASGYNPKSGSARFITRFGLGLDAKFPTSLTVGDGRRLFIGTYAIAYYYLNELEFRTIGDQDITVRGELEFGLALGGDPAFKILGFEFDRLGVAYRSSGDVDAILLVTRFPF
jgi:hypothetical protein